MRRLSASEVSALHVGELGLDPTAIDLESVEAIAGALRRAASFCCPCPRRTLVQSVVQPLRGLVGDVANIKTTVERTLEAMIALGDIHEHPEVEGDPESPRAMVLYPAPPTFVARASGAVILLGVGSDRVTPLPDDLALRVEYANHVRRLVPEQGEDLLPELSERGWIQLSDTSWLDRPARESPAQHLSRVNRLLDGARQSGDVPGLSLLDPERRTRFYRGRWASPCSESGRFVARRSQAYGADLWCYIELKDGNPERIVDFPVESSRWRGCDDAWRLQLAIDAQRGKPQQLEVVRGPAGSRMFKFFSPVPMWAQRRWDAVAEPVPSSGCLFAYRIRESEVAEELRFAEQDLWLSQLGEELE